MIKYPKTPPIKELIWFGKIVVFIFGSKDLTNPMIHNGKVKESGIIECFRSIKKIIIKKILNVINSRDVIVKPK